MKSEDEHDRRVTCIFIPREGSWFPDRNGYYGQGTGYNSTQTYIESPDRNMWPCKGRDLSVLPSNPTRNLHVCRPCARRLGLEW